MFLKTDQTSFFSNLPQIKSPTKIINGSETDLMCGFENVFSGRFILF